LWQLFNYFDVSQSGHLARPSFELALQTCRGSMVVWPCESLDSGFIESVWCDLGGEARGGVNFARFATWAASEGVNLPLGLDGSGASRPCRSFKLMDDVGNERCSCTEYQHSATPGICTCGHKQSMHRSDVAEGSLSAFTASMQVSNWNADGLQELRQTARDKGLFLQLQKLLTDTHKPYDSWTRDRGCSLHGRNSSECSTGCLLKNKAQVPKGYVLRRAYRNQNTLLWERYCLAKTAISHECARPSSADFSEVPVLSGVDLNDKLDISCNEWRVLHGTSQACARDICSSNFQMAFVGTGATWKAAGKEKGMPLYGLGIYGAERITKADEYSKPVFDSKAGAELFPVLVLRCVGGRANVVLTNDINRHQLRKDIYEGPYHSVVGDRVKKLGKPYREIVIYDKDQCFPEYLLMYERRY